MNLAFLKQVLNFIIVSLDPPRLGCQPECAQEKQRSLPEVNAERFQSDCGWLELPWPQNHFSCFHAWCCVSVPSMWENYSPFSWARCSSVLPPSPSSSLWVKLCFKQCPPLSKLTTGIFKSRQQNLVPPSHSNLALWEFTSTEMDLTSPNRTNPCS